MNENELSSYRSQLEQWADKVIPASRPFVVYLSNVGCEMVESGLLPADEDPCYRQKWMCMVIFLWQGKKSTGM